MALEQITFNIGAFNDSDASGNNYFVNKVFEVKNQSDNTFATIYTDASGATQIPQNGIDNISNSRGECNFYIDDGDFYLEVDSQQKNFNVGKFKTDFANIDEVKAYPKLSKLIGQRIQTKEYHAGTGYGGASYDVVSAGSVTPNGIDIIQGVADGEAAVVIAEDSPTASQYGVNTYEDSTVRLQRYIDTLQSGSGVFNVDVECTVSEAGTITRPSYSINYCLLTEKSLTYTGKAYLKTNQADAFAIIVKGADVESDFIRFKVDGGFEIPTLGGAVCALNSDNIKITGCRFKNIRNPWKLESDEDGNIGNTADISGNTFINTGQSGTKPSGFQNLIVSNNLYKTVWQTGISIEGELTGAQPITEQGKRCVVEGNILFDFRGTSTGGNLDGRIQGIQISEMFNEVIVALNIVEGDLDGVHSGDSTGIQITTSPTQDDSTVYSVKVALNQVRKWDRNIALICGDSDVSNIQIENNSLDSPKTRALTFISPTGGTGKFRGITVKNNTARRLDSTGPSARGLYIQDADSLDFIDGMSIVGNEFEGFAGDYYIGGGDNIDVEDNKSKNSTGLGFEIFKARNIDNNTSTNSAFQGFRVTDFESFTSNKVFGTQANQGIALIGSTGKLVACNEVYDAFSDSIALNGTVSAIVKQNTTVNSGGNSIRVESSSSTCLVYDNDLDKPVSSAEALLTVTRDSNGNVSI